MMTINYSEAFEEAERLKNPRPGERVQTWWCDDCQEWHEGSVLGGPVLSPDSEPDSEM